MAGRMFLGGDWHTFHHKIAEPRGFASTEEHDDWVVGTAVDMLYTRDSLILAGDVLFSTVAKFDALLEKHMMRRFPGWKPGDGMPFTLKVVEGNHDRNSLRDSKYVSIVKGVLEIKYKGKKYVITHIPIHPVSVSRWTANIHAHLHEESINDSMYIGVSVEQVGPAILLDDLIAKHEEKWEALSRWCKM